MRRAEASGSSGSRQTVSVARAGWSCRCRRWRRRSRGGSRRSARRARPAAPRVLSSRISSTSAGSLPSTAASRRASRAGDHRGEPADPALGLGDDLLGDDDDVAVAQLGARRRSARRRASPRSISGRPATGVTCSSPGSVAHMPSAFAVRLARPRLRLQLAGQGDDVGRGVEVERRARPAPRPRRGCRPRGRRRRGGRSCPRRRPGGSRSGGASASALVPVPWRSGTIADVALGHPGQQPVELARVEQRAVAGEQHDALGPVGLGPGDARPAPPRSGRPSAGSGTTSAPGRCRRARRARGSLVTTIVRSIERAAPIASSTSSSIAAASAARRSSSMPAARRCLAAAKRLTGRIAVAFNSRRGRASRSTRLAA